MAKEICNICGKKVELKPFRDNPRNKQCPNCHCLTSHRALVDNLKNGELLLPGGGNVLDMRVAARQRFVKSGLWRKIWEDAGYKYFSTMDVFPAGMKFDAIVCIGRLEKAQDQLAYYKGMLAMIAPGGMLYVDTIPGVETDTFIRRKSSQFGFRARGSRMTGRYVIYKYVKPVEKPPEPEEEPEAADDESGE